MSATTKDTLPIIPVNSKITTFGGLIHCQWDEDSPITLHGHLPYFCEFMHTGGLFERLVKNCPLKYKSNNAPEVGSVVGTILLSILAGHTRYRHAGSLYGDTVSPTMLGIGQLVSYDSLRRAFAKVDEKASVKWLQDELLYCCEPLLSSGYVLDLDPTVKPLYGHQEGAKKGYNPKKPGRPSHCYHSYFIGSLRLVLDAEVRAGNETAGRYSHEGLWDILDKRLPRHLHPAVIRGDIGFGNEDTMSGCESRQLKYLFKLRQSVNVKNLVEQLEKSHELWQDAGEGWQGYETKLKLMGWSSSRRVIVLRRHASQRSRKDTRVNLLPAPKTQVEEELFFPEVIAQEQIPEYDWAVLVTNLDYSIVAASQLYRDRGDCENIFDELKNQWGWGGFTTQDIKRSGIMARIVALVYNWWNIFCRLAEPDKHMEAKTSRPLLQQVIGRLSNCGGKRLLHLTAVGAQAADTKRIFEQISSFLNQIISTAAQLNPVHNWTLILAQAFKVFLRGRAICPGSEGSQILLPMRS